MLSDRTHNATAATADEVHGQDIADRMVRPTQQGLATHLVRRGNVCLAEQRCRCIGTTGQPPSLVSSVVKESSNGSISWERVIAFTSATLVSRGTCAAKPAPAAPTPAAPRPVTEPIMHRT